MTNLLIARMLIKLIFEDIFANIHSYVRTYLYIYVYIYILYKYTNIYVYDKLYVGCGSDDLCAVMTGKDIGYMAERRVTFQWVRIEPCDPWDLGSKRSVLSLWNIVKGPRTEVTVPQEML